MSVNQTLCWRCNAAYPINLDRCPDCRATNSNVDFDAAFAEMRAENQPTPAAPEFDGPTRVAIPYPLPQHYSDMLIEAASTKSMRAVNNIENLIRKEIGVRVPMEQQQ